jgi:Flp pilus assembly protein TadB
LSDGHIAELEAQVGKRGDEAATKRVKEVERDLAGQALDGLLDRVSAASCWYCWCCLLVLVLVVLLVLLMLVLVLVVCW